MPTIESIIEGMRNNPKDVRFVDLARVCDKLFGKATTKGSHRRYKTPWQGDPRINIQKFGDGKAKPYQVKQVLDAIERLERSDEADGEKDAEV